VYSPKTIGAVGIPVVVETVVVVGRIVVVVVGLVVVGLLVVPISSEEVVVARIEDSEVAVEESICVDTEVEDISEVVGKVGSVKYSHPARNRVMRRMMPSLFFIVVSRKIVDVIIS
jgi:hypothetical protein